MIISEAAQGSPDWYSLRMGIPTASEFHRIVQPGGEPRFKKDGSPYKSHEGELADGRWKYACELACERLLNESKQTIDGLQWVERGKMLEPDAVELYESLHGRTAQCGFICPDDRRYGCSPDRIHCDELGGLELKCPSGPIHLWYFINNGPGHAYRCQVQGSLMVTGFTHWDFMSYHPNFPEVLVRFERDEPFIAKLREGLDQFCREVDGIVAKIKEAGYVPPPGPMVTPVDQFAKMLEADQGLWAIGD